MTIPTRIIDETIQRFAERASHRKRVSEQLDRGAVLLADTPQRVELRLARLAADTTGGPSAGGESSQLPVNALERVLGRSDLMSVSYLEAGLWAARCIGRVVLRDADGRSEGYGTGFMVSPRLMLTNNHVLPNRQSAAHSRVEFNYQEDAYGNPLRSVAILLDPALLFMTDVALDFTLVAVSQTAVDGTPLSGFCWLPLLEQQGKVIIGEYVNIIQHPNGEPKQIALRENRLIDVLPLHLHYKTDTAPGSSGSPIFNDQWEVVGLHHSGVPDTDNSGRILSRDGTPWREEMGEHRIRWIANEGIRVSQIVRRIRAEVLSDPASRLRGEIFGAPPPRSAGHRPAAEHRDRAAGPVPAAGPDGSVTWSIPLKVTVRFGTASTAIADGSAGGPADMAVRDDLPAPGYDTKPDSDEDADLDAALRELEVARSRPYLDETDASAADAYYRDIDPGTDPDGLFGQLQELLVRTHRDEIPYKPMLHVYPWVDLHEDGRLRSIYSGKPFEPEDLIREDARIGQERRRLRERFRAGLAERTHGAVPLDEIVDLLEAAAPYNCEHVVPQSWFGRREPMRGDLHHLFACESRCNSFRGNNAYHDFPDFEEVVRDECGKLEHSCFEPSAGKGAVARATLYFLIRYPGQIGDAEKEYQRDALPTLIAWHKHWPPTDYERHRNAAIFEKQGNRNPLIDRPEWADGIAFERGLA